MTRIRVFQLLLATVLAAACSASDIQQPQQGPKPVSAVQVSSPSPTLQVGRQLTMVATPRAADGEALQRTVTWSSTNEQVATVSASGVVTAIAPGPVTIVATSESRSGSASIVVAEAPLVSVAEVRLSVDEEVQLDWDGSAQLHALALDAQGNVLPGRAAQWSSSKPTVVAVSQTGAVRAVGPGVANLTASIEGVPATVGVRVKSAPVTEVILSVPIGASGLEAGETIFVGTRVKLASGQIVDSPLHWTSSDPSVATASSNAPGAAAVVAHGAGVAALSGSVDGKSATVQLRISQKPTHDLIYSRWDGATASEIFILPLGTAGATPVRINAGSVSRDPSPSPDGSQLVFAVSQRGPLGDDQHDLYIVNRNGLNMRRLTSDAGMEYEPAWSPDGTKILFTATDASGTDQGIWTVNVDGSGLRKLTAALPAGMSNTRNPSWSPDSRRIAFTAAVNGQHKVWTMNADGSGATQLTTGAGFDVNPAWSPDGTQIAFSRYNAAIPANGWDIVIVPAAGGAASQIELVGDQLLPAWSPDGRYIALTGTAVAGQGLQNLYTLRPDGSGLRLRTVNPAWSGGIAPAWVIRQ